MQRNLKIGLEVGVGPIDRSLASHDDQISRNRWEPTQHIGDSSPQPAPSAIAFDGITDFFGGGKADTKIRLNRRGVRVLSVIRVQPGLQYQARRRPPAVCPGDGEKFAALLQMMESSGHGNSPYAERRLRPLARRRDNTSRPFLVAIRARKP